MKLQAAAVLGVIGVGVIAALYVWKKGGIAPAASAIGAAVIDGATGAASGAVGAVGQAVAGLPTPAQTTTDAAVSRYLIDTAGLGFASRWSGVPALASAVFMPPGTGRAPAPGTPVYQALVTQAPAQGTGDFARLDRASYYDNAGRYSSNGGDEPQYDALGNRTF